MRTIYPIRVLCHLERCCYHLTATQVGDKYVLSIEGGRFDGITIYCHSEESVIRLFDATTDALTSGQPAWWLAPISMENGKVA